MHSENRVLRLLDPGSHLGLYQCRVVFQPHCCKACCPGCTEAQEVQSYSFVVRHTVLVKLTQEDDVACLHKQVYEWQSHKVVFMKVHRIELLPDVLDDVHGKVRLVFSPN